MSLIDNETVPVKDVIRSISQGETERVDILVAYFNLEGFRVIAEALRDKPVRILIGLKFKFGRRHRDTVRPLIDAMNQTALFKLMELPPSIQKSAADTQTAWRILNAKLKDGSLKIRKSQTKNHSKMYLFHQSPGSKFYPYIVIFGSSNLTAAGLASQNELNMCFADKSSQFVDQFDRLWQKTRAINGYDFSSFPSLRLATRPQAKLIDQQSAQANTGMSASLKTSSKSYLISKDGKPICPIHKINMILRKGRQGQKEFWGCSEFAKLGCRQRHLKTS